jgi:hypothetical protein
MLADRGIPVVAIRDTPRWSSNPLDCLSENAARPEQCYVARGDTLNAGDPTIAISPRPSGVAFVDFSDILCRAAKCPAVIGNVTVYMDDDHLTSSFVRTMASVFAERVVAAAGRSMSSLLTSGSVH